MNDQRLNNEIAHGKHLKELGATKIWRWDTPTGRFRMKRRVDFLSSHITPGMAVLEIGCGTGIYTHELAATAAQIISIDISPELLAIAKENNQHAHITFKCENAYATSFGDNTFNTIVGSSSLHHLDVEKALKEFHRILKPEGSIHFTEPNMCNPHIIFERTIPFLRKKLGVSKDETAFYRWQLTKLLRQYGFSEIKILPFDFLYPLTPKFLIPVVNNLGRLCEKIPLIREIAGSLYIEAHK